MVEATYDSSLEADDPRADAIEVEVAQERARAAMFGGSSTRHHVGRFLLMAPIGRGGMGTVFAAYDPQLDRRVAIKLLRPRGRDPAHADALRERMLREARAMARISHPHVVTVHEAGVADDDVGGSAFVYLAMELVEGVTLRRWVAQERRSWQEIVAVHVAAGRGLAAAHGAGLVHRDFKPDNAMIGADGRVRVMDFGLARELDDGSIEVDPAERMPPQANATQPAGTPGYMAPEQQRGLAVDHRVDQYALCASLHESLWGSVPVPGVRELPRMPAPPRVRAAIVRGLAADREQRFPSMDALLHALSPVRRGRALVVATGIVASAGAAIALAVARPQPCRGDDGATDVLLQTGAIEQAFAATELGYARDEAARAIAGLKAYARAWTDERRRACEATHVDGTQSQARYDRRMRCLERRRQEAIAVAHELTAADATTVDRAAATIARLTAPDRCDDDAVLDAVGPLPDASIAADVDRLEAELARAVAVLELGRPADAAAVAEQVHRDAKAIELAPLMARAQVLHARAVSHAGEHADAMSGLRAAFFAAREAGQPEPAASAALDLAALVAGKDGQLEAARLWLELGRSELAIHGLELESHALDAEAAIAQSAGEWETAIALARQRLALIESRCPDGCDERGATHLTIATALDDLGRHDEASSHARKALDDELSRHDPEHPHVAEARQSLGQALGLAGRPHEAIAELTAAVSAFEARFGAHNLDVATAQGALGRALYENGRVDEAIALLERAVAASAHEAGSLLHASLQHALGSAYYWAGRLDDAETALRRALAIQEEIFPEGHGNTAMALGELANLDFERGRYEAAIEGYQRALAMRRAVLEGDDPRNALILNNIGTAHEKLGRGAEALPWYEQAAELTAVGPIDSLGVHARLRVAVLRFATDPGAALASIEEAERRCAALVGEQLASARCERLAKWRAEHASPK